VVEKPSPGRAIPAMRRLSIAIGCLILGTSAYAQEVDEALARLLSAKSIRCEIGKGTQASWEGGKLRREESEFGEGAKATFDSIDAQAGKARIIGNAGAGDLMVLVTTAGLTFVEPTALGNINFTTVFASYDSPVSRRFVAVSSRHQSINGPFPSQYHGTCSILE